MRRLMMLLLLTGLVWSLAAPAGADRPGKVELVQERSAAVVVGDTVWLAFTWRAKGDLENFRVVVRRTDAAEFGYPENTATYSGPFQSPHLMDGEIDYTAIQVHGAGAGRQINVVLRRGMEAAAASRRSTTSRCRRRSTRAPMLLR